MRTRLGVLALGGLLAGIAPAIAQNNTIDAHPQMALPIQVGDELLLWRTPGVTAKATLTQTLALIGIGGDCSGVGGPVVSIVCALDASKITTGTFNAARIPAPSTTTLGGTRAVLPVAHQYMTSISASGIPSIAQPSLADLSDGTHAMTGADLSNAARSGAAPANVSACGTSPTIGTGSTDFSGTINVGTGTVTSCTVAFAAAHNPTLRCWVEPSSGQPVGTATAVTATSLVVTLASSLGAGTFDYGCQ